MKKITILSVCLFFLVQFNFSQEIYKRIIVQSNSQNTINQILDAGIDLRCGAIFGDNSIQLELSPNEIIQLDNLGIPYQVKIDNLTSFYNEGADEDYKNAIINLNRDKIRKISNKSSLSQKSISSKVLDNYLQYDNPDEVNWITPTNFNLGAAFRGCLTVDETLAELDEMRSLYPNLISAKTDASPSNQKTWGNPATTITNNGLTYSGENGGSNMKWNPQTIYYVRITGNQSNPEGTKPQILYTSMIHAREVSSLMSNIFFMWYILENYDSDPAIKNLVDNNELYFIPVVNPDGLKWNQNLNPNGTTMQRKNLRPNTGSGETRGVDVNRNFDYLWGADGLAAGSSNIPNSDTYRGPYPFSEPESQILRDFVLGRNFETALMHHAAANAIPHPYGGIPTTVSGREDEMHQWHEDMTKYNRYISGATIFTPANGIADDWMIGGSPDGGNITNNSANGYPNDSSPSSVGSGKNILASTPENGDWETEGGFWPATTQITPIAKRALRINLMNAYYGGKYAKLHDLTQSNIETLTSNLTFGIERIGQTNSNFNLVVTPISSNITSIASIPEQTGMTVLEQRNVTAQLILDGSIQPDDKIEYNVQLSDGTNVFYNVNVKKYYQPSVLFSHDPDSNGLTGWTQSGGWNNTSIDSYSGNNALRTGDAVPYDINTTKILTTTNSYDLSSSSEILIQFYTKWDLERNFDFVEIEGSANGSTWQSLSGKYNKPEAETSTTDEHREKSTATFQSTNSSGRVYDGDRMDKWVMEEIVIDASNNAFLNGATNAQFRFRFRSDGDNKFENYTANAEGFFIDDFKIISVQIPCDNSNPPTGITADVTTTALSAIINWDAIPSATYDVRYRQIGAPTWTEITDIAANSYTINSLTDATDYEVQVSTRCTIATSSYSLSVNFTATACTGSSISSFPYSESFESGLGLWSQSANGVDDDMDWTSNSGTTTSTATGPTGASSGSQYIYTETSSNVTPPGNPNKVAFLSSPCIELNGYENSQLEFDYHMYGADIGSLNIDVSTDNGINYVSIFNLIGQQQGSNAAAWMTQSINLSLYDGQTIKLRFNALSGASFNGDIAIDNINITANVASATTWYEDSDGDTFGNPSVSQLAVSQPLGYVADNTDCDDTDNTINPDTLWYVGVDADGDGFFGSTNTVTQCTSPGAGYSLTVPATPDCNDSDSNINPGATEIPNNTIDEDCDGIAQTTLNNDVFNLENVSITPNPFYNYLTITLPLSFNGNELNIILYDVNGRYIYNKNIQVNHNGHVNILSGLSRLNEGVYFIQVTNLNVGTSLVKKLVKY